MERRRFLQMVTAAAIGGRRGDRRRPCGRSDLGRRPGESGAGPQRRPRHRPRPEPLDRLGVERRGRQDPHRGEPRQHGGDHGDRREHDVRRSCRRRPRRLPRGLAVGRHGRRAGVPRRGQCRPSRPARRRRTDRLVRAPLRPGAVSRDGDVGGLPRSRGGQPNSPAPKPATSAASSAPTRRSRSTTKRSSRTSGCPSRSSSPARKPPPWQPSTRPCPPRSRS